MIRINENYLKLQGNYLFAEIANRIADYQQSNPDKQIIKLGIGDVTEPLPESVLEGLRQGVADMSKRDSFKGYGSGRGYPFLREKIAEMDFKSRGISISEDDIFVSTGAKEDSANFQELFSIDCSIAITDPVYPVYLDSNVMAGRTGSFNDGRFSGVTYLDCTEENNFIPDIPSTKVDLVYLCFPNNPTGQVADKATLKKWVDYALENKALILFDAAYERFITQSDIPHSIFEIEGAKKCAVEFRSLSKTAGFTGTRLSYTVIPEQTRIFDSEGNEHQLKALWSRRQSTKFNGTAYVIQKGAEQVFTPSGEKEVQSLIDYYLGNAKIIADGISSLGIDYSGGVNSPYIWFKTPGGRSSWDFFSLLLNECQVVGTPGVGFGQCGAGYFRLSAFGKRESVEEAVSRLKGLAL
jgi:LL-diaminopimelate aminotransferase